MLAEGDDGPLIPSMAVAAIVRNELGGRRPAAGARAATGELELADYDAIFRPYAIRHAIRDDSALDRGAALSTHAGGRLGRSAGEPARDA